MDLNLMISRVNCVLIVDDICRKGGTAYYSSKNLHSLGVAGVYLYITHCEDVIEQGEILKNDTIKGVYTTDSEFQVAGVALDMLR